MNPLARPRTARHALRPVHTRSRPDAFNIAPALAAALALTMIAGCVSPGHGKHTSEALAQAQDRMASLKAGTNWDMAQQQFLVGDLKKALENVDKSLAFKDSVPKSHTLKGRIFMELGQLEGAIQSFERALAIDPAFVEAHYYLGIAKERASMYEEALEKYQAAAALDPSNPQYPLASAEMLIELGRLDQAEKLMNESRSAFEHNAGVRQTLGHIARLRGQPAQSAELFEEAHLLAPDDLSLLEDLAVAQMESGRPAEAEYNLGKLLENKQFADRKDLKHLRARCLVMLDRPVEARHLLMEITSEDAGASDFQAWVDLGNVALMLGDHTRVRIAAGRLRALAPKRPEGYMLAAMQLRRAGELDEALKQVEQASARADGRSAPLLLQGLILQEMGRPKKAEESFIAALQAEPNDKQAKRMLSLVQQQERVLDD